MPRDLVPPAHRILDYVRRATGAERIKSCDLTRLPGGAVMRHFRLDLDMEGGAFAGPQSWVLRRSGITQLGIGLERAQEFAVQRALFAAGLKVAEPLFMCCDRSVIGAPFFLMRFLPGEARGAALVARGLDENLAIEIGRELARLHALDLERALHFLLPAPPEDPAASRIAELERHLAADDDPHPVAEWALRWLKRAKPAPVRPVFCHGDFRSGNYLAKNGELVAVLDWDFAGWSDPDEDIGWFCAKSWRYGAFAYEAGGIAPRAAFYRGYETVAGRRIDPERIRYWEVMAALRWLVIALKQRDRFLKQGERSPDLALTGRRLAECELEILLLTGSGSTPVPLGQSGLGDREGIDPGCSNDDDDAFRDRPSGAQLAALAREGGGDSTLIARCEAIAAREAASKGAFAACQAALKARYGAWGGAAGLACLAAEIRGSAFETSGAARDWILPLLWEITRQKLRGSNPEFLAANDLISARRA